MERQEYVVLRKFDTNDDDDVLEFIDEAEALLAPFVDEVNDLIDSVNQLENRGIDYIEPQHIYIPMIQKFAAEYSQSTMAEMLAQSNPYLAIELGLLTLREAIRDGYIPLTKEHVLDRVIGYSELTRDIIEALKFTPEEYKALGR